MVWHAFMLGVHEITRMGLQTFGAQQSSWGCAVHEVYLSIAQVDFLHWRSPS